MADENKRGLHECGDALVDLADAFSEGDGVEQDFEKAACLYRLAAEQGYDYAQWQLGRCYENGKGVHKNLVVAAKWYRKAADQGHAAAQFFLGCCYASGDGVKLSDKEAVKWFLESAEQGCCLAQSMLGLWYQVGIGVKQSDEVAAKWYRLAAEQGDDDAQFDLAMCYVEGCGVKQSDVEAEKWLRKAAAQGNEEAQEKLDQLLAKKTVNVVGMSEVGEACWDGTIGDLLSFGRDMFKKTMKANFTRYVRKQLSHSEVASWMDTFDTLKEVFSNFDDEDLAKWKPLRISFEMVLPNQRRPDVLIFTERMIFVLEFKRHEEPWEKRINEVNAYRRKIEKWPEICKGRKVRGIVVYTRLEDYDYRQGRSHICSSDLLGEKLLYLQPSPEP